MINLTALDNSQTNIFDIIPVEAEIDFKILRGIKPRSVGEDRNTYIVRERPFAPSEYQITFKGLKPSEMDNLKAINELLKTNVGAFGFNDVSDNFVLPWSSGDGVTQNGIVLPIVGQADSYMGCKVYTCGSYQTIEPIFYYPSESEVEVDGVIQDSSLDRSTGIITSNTDITGARLATDLYYKTVSLSSNLSYSPYYNRGSDIGTGTRADNTADNQLFNATFSLRQRILNVPVNIDLFTEGTETFSSIYFNPWINGMLFEDSHRVDKWEHNNFVVTNSVANQRVNRTIRIPERIYQHKELLYWQTIFKATGGTGLTLDV